MKYFFLFFLVFHGNTVKSQSKTDNSIKILLTSKASPFLLHILNNPDSFHYQLIYTQINRDIHNIPHFKNYYLDVDSNQYFNPASTVKLPTAVLALEKINDLNIAGFSKNSVMLTDSSYAGQISVIKDTTSANGLPSVAQYIQRIFLVSDNDAYNRLYEFDDQTFLNESLWNKGFTGTKLSRRFMPFNDDENRHTNQIRFFNEDKLIYTQPAAVSRIDFHFNKKILTGNAHWNNNDSLVSGPFDFSTANVFPLEDMQRVLQTVIFPQSVSLSHRFHLTKKDYGFLYQYMSEYPGESIFPEYDLSEFYTCYGKFFMYGADSFAKPSARIRIFNKTGWAYGFLTDIAYIVDFKNKTEFMLTGTIYVNSDGVINDNKYDYKTVGLPFFKEVGNIIYNYELKRTKKYLPDLKNFMLSYQKDN